jgi:hypothetical protein
VPEVSEPVFDPFVHEAVPVANVAVTPVVAVLEEMSVPLNL